MALEFAKFPPAHKARTIELPPVFGWRINPMEHHQIKNQMLRWKRGHVVRVPTHPHRRDHVVPKRNAAQAIDPKVRRQFTQHAKRWRRDMATSSSITAIALHPSYQTILGMGDAALPMIFKELSKSLDHWFWALHYITKDNPVPKEEEGDLDAMRARWLDWGRTHGYLA